MWKGARIDCKYARRGGLSYSSVSEATATIPCSLPFPFYPLSILFLSLSAIRPMDRLQVKDRDRDRLGKELGEKLVLV